jgi:flagellar biosynthesis protein
LARLRKVLKHPARRKPTMLPDPKGEALTTDDMANRPSAIALSYANKNRAPRVVAKGYGAVADTIIQHARANGLYVHESPQLVKLLMQVSLDDEIPPQLYLAVAQVLAWLYEIETANCE